jgi:MFS family permease
MTTEPNRDITARGLRAIPHGIWALGFVSMFMDISSEMIHSLLPIFLISVLGASATSIGILEGVSESAVLVTKMFSGALSDWLGKRKTLAVAGYGIAALTKPLFPLAGSFPVVFAARLIDRIGKGIRGAPRDALVADIVSKDIRGASYGLRQSLDTMGALIGPLAGTLLMITGGGNFRLVFWIAVLPAFVSVIVLVRFVNEPAGPRRPINERLQIRWHELQYFSPAFWSVVAVGAVFTLARFSEAFLVLRASSLGLAIAYVPLTMVVMNVAYAACAYPAGWLSDRIDRRIVLAMGAGVLIIADLVLAGARGITGLAIGVALWGLHMGLSQGLLAALVADAAPMERRGTAFGLFNLISGIVLLLASVIAGGIWDRLGAAATFYAGAGFAGFALLGLLLQIQERPSREFYEG